MCVACACSQGHSVSSCGVHDNTYNKTRYNTRTERLVERMYAQAGTEPVITADCRLTADSWPLLPRHARCGAAPSHTTNRSFERLLADF